MNDSTRRAVWGVLLACAAASGADATTYYVRATGSDLATGTSPALAWATVAYAVDQVSAGDVIYVGAGAYSGEITPSNDGTSGNPISVIADTGGSQTGDAGTVTLSRSGRVIRLDNDDYWQFTGFVITNTSTSDDTVAGDDSEGIVFTNCTITGADDTLDLGDCTTTLTNCTIGTANDDGIAADGGALTVIGCTIDGIGDKAIQLRGGIDIIIDACTILDGDIGISFEDAQGLVTNTLIADDDMDDGIQLTNVNDDIELINCTIWGVNGDGLDVDDGNALVRNVIFSDIGDSCMEGSSSTIDADTNLMWQYGGSRSAGFNSPNENYYDPQFEDEGGGDFSLASGSGAIDDGLDMSSYTSTDLNGGARPAGSAYDIGAYEYGSAAYTAADIPYTTDFESGVGDEWVGERTDSSGGFTDYLGYFGEESSVDLSTSIFLNTTAGMTYELVFDAYIIDDWDPASGGDADTLSVSADGTNLMTHTFDSSGGGDQSYGSPPDTYGSDLGKGAADDAIYRSVTLTFVAADSETEILFQGANTDTTANESWGIDNVSVDEVPPVFVDVTAAATFGVDTNAALHDGSGWHWMDFDGDGDLDAFVSGQSACILRQDSSDGTFTAYAMGNYPRGTAVLDADGDGDPDLYNADNTNLNLFENLGGFPVARGDVGVDGPSNVEHVVAADVDANGVCDLVVMAENGNWIAMNMGAGYSGYSPTGFEDSEDVGAGMNDAGDVGNGDYVSSADANNDGHLDFFSHYGTGKLFLSDGDGTYTEGFVGIVTYVDNNYKFGSAWGDYDNDGDMDLYTPDARTTTPGILWGNTADGLSFVDVAAATGILAIAEMHSATWGDYDNDGDLDLYIATGSGVANLLYTNNGDGTFTAEDHGAGLTGDFQDAVFVDYDSDGDLDIALSRLDGDGRTVLLQNQTDDTNYLKVRVVGQGPVNTLGIGTRVELYNADGSSLLAMREIGTARGYGGTEPLWAHFGGVDPVATYTLRMVWPGGEEQFTTVVPQDVSTTIGANTVAQMVTVVSDIGGAKFVRWREVDPTE
ncbi:MAG: hypothetical protein DHS20C14_11840 [Phycisphaeraceae bacterium]|nr:MAG: hypothetical protein DHS20C14_11840 [Phycisphaeraceae bacterium]